jgi:hypothetical protein
MELTRLLQNSHLTFFTYTYHSSIIKHIRCHHAMSSHNNIHMCSVPYQSHRHTETSSVKSYKTNHHYTIHMLCMLMYMLIIIISIFVNHVPVFTLLAPTCAIYRVKPTLVLLAFPCAIYKTRTIFTLLATTWAIYKIRPVTSPYASFVPVLTLLAPTCAIYKVRPILVLLASPWAIYKTRTVLTLLATT